VRLPTAPTGGRKPAASTSRTGAPPPTTAGSGRSERAYDHHARGANHSPSTAPSTARAQPGAVDAPAPPEIDAMPAHGRALHGPQIVCAAGRSASRIEGDESGSRPRAHLARWALLGPGDQDEHRA
jgi:hypothetical protein